MNVLLDNTDTIFDITFGSMAFVYISLFVWLLLETFDNALQSYF